MKEIEVLVEVYDDIETIFKNLHLLERHSEIFIDTML